MPNTKSAAKKIRVSERNRLYNRFWKSRIKTEIKKVLAAIEAKNLELAQNLFSQATSIIDKAVRKGVLHRNNGARKKSRLANKINQLKALLASQAPSSL
ncbi:MAG: 30S ribosomal protein S20 [Synergistetes bacterium]|nr:30S ribosomal protein S20 [Synergistota bacterium]MCX8128355.1 30S ribosomal protein S20 [Synergistota bacterium]MDW8192987.1 30S ribosomal protein S20 [Synergistota bacterium]